MRDMLQDMDDIYRRLSNPLRAGHSFEVYSWLHTHQALRPGSSPSRDANINTVHDLSSAADLVAEAMRDPGVKAVEVWTADRPGSYGVRRKKLVGRWETGSAGWTKVAGTREINL